MSTLEQRAAFYTNNRNKLRKQSKNCDLIVITANSALQASADRILPFEQDSNFFYLTGIEESGIRLVVAKNEEYLVLPERSDIRISFEGAVDTDRLAQLSGIAQIYDYEQGMQKLTKAVQEAKTIGTLLSIDAYIKEDDFFVQPSRQRLINELTAINESLELIDLRLTMAKLRCIKSAYEIRAITQAIKLTYKALKKLERTRQKATNERELHAELVRNQILLDVKEAYEPIIAGGKNAVTLHYIDNNASLNPSELLLLDVGFKYEGYSADITMTRTLLS